MLYVEKISDLRKNVESIQTNHILFCVLFVFLSWVPFLLREPGLREAGEDLFFVFIRKREKFLTAHPNFFSRPLYTKKLSREGRKFLGIAWKKVEGPQKLKPDLVLVLDY
jgi:hypothetical protein